LGGIDEVRGRFEALESWKALNRKWRKEIPEPNTDAAMSFSENWTESAVPAEQLIRQIKVGAEGLGGIRQNCGRA
jgi:GH24 family phage-related lysozyme (muramidase)